jgi:hypothetical protein
MKFETQTRNIIPNLKIPKPEVTTKIQDGHRRHHEFHILGCRFIAICPISTKISLVVPLMVLSVQKQQILIVKTAKPFNLSCYKPSSPENSRNKK